MIRSSSLHSTLSRVCNNGIYAALLITKDGELLGSYISEGPIRTSSGSNNMANQSTNPQEDGTNKAPIDKPNLNSEEKDENEESKSKQRAFNIDPKDIGALVAETVDDYKRLGFELGLLNPLVSPSYKFSSLSSTMTNNTSEIRRESANESSTSKNVNGGEGNESTFDENGNDPSRESPSMNNMNNPNPTIEGTTTNPTNTSRKERGRLHCLMLELDQGIVGVAGATSNTYVVTLAEEEAHQGMIKGRLLALASHIREAFSQLD